MSDNSILGILVIIVAGAAAAGFGGYMWMEQGDRIDSYEQTEATVLSSEVDVDTRNDPDGGTEQTYTPEITYEYTVDGQTYESSNVMPGPGESSTGQSRANSLVEEHPEGETVTAYYDPENPSNSFLVKNQQLLFLGIAGFGGLFSLLGVASLGKRMLGLAM